MEEEIEYVIIVPVHLGVLGFLNLYEPRRFFFSNKEREREICDEPM